VLHASTIITTRTQKHTRAHRFPRPFKVRKEAEKAVKGGDNRIDDIIAQKLRDMNLNVAEFNLKIPDHCVVNSRAHMRKCASHRFFRPVPLVLSDSDFLCRYAADAKSEDMDSSFFRSPPAKHEIKTVTSHLTALPQIEP
jgi:hypothetical protein